MYGIIGKIITTSGMRDNLINILIKGSTNMPGNLSYVVSKDTLDENAIWITEVWDSQASHQASLSLPEVQKAIARGKPIIAEFGDRIEIQPIGGYGINQA